MKELCDGQAEKMRTTGVGRGCAWFSKYRYEKTVEGIKLEEELKEKEQTILRSKLSNWE